MSYNISYWKKNHRNWNIWPSSLKILMISYLRCHLQTKWRKKEAWYDFPKNAFCIADREKGNWNNAILCCFKYVFMSVKQRWPFLNNIFLVLLCINVAFEFMCVFINKRLRHHRHRGQLPRHSCPKTNRKITGSAACWWVHSLFDFAFETEM